MEQDDDIKRLKELITKSHDELDLLEDEKEEEMNELEKRLKKNSLDYDVKRLR